MMNRKERRRIAREARAVGRIIEVKLGRVTYDASEQVNEPCYVCGRPVTAWGPFEGGTAHGIADIDDETFLLCEVCWNAELKGGSAVYRKYANAPDIKIEEGGRISDDVLNALKERDGKPEH
jgi:hypothetical protein